MTTPTPHTSLEVLALRMARQLRELAELLELLSAEHDALRAEVATIRDGCVACKGTGRAAPHVPASCSICGGTGQYPAVAA